MELHNCKQPWQQDVVTQSGSSLSMIFGILKKSYYAKFVLVSTTQPISTSTNFTTYYVHRNSTSTNFIPMEIKFVLVEIVLVETVLVGDPLYQLEIINDILLQLLQQIIETVHISFCYKNFSKIYVPLLVSFLNRFLYLVLVFTKHSSMEEVLVRFFHLGKQIFGEIDDENFINCRKSGRSWKQLPITMRATMDICLFVKNIVLF